MSQNEKLLNILNEIKSEVNNLSDKFSQRVSSTRSNIISTEEEVQTFPKLLLDLDSRINELNTEITKLENELSSTNQTINSTQGEIEVHQENLEDLKIKETEKRDYKETLAKEIAELTEKNILFESEINEKTAQQKKLEEEYKSAEMRLKEKITELEQKINEITEKLDTAKEENKLIVYLMDAGLMDVPEAEIISVIASNPGGLTINELKQKVSIPSVRVQPTINNLLEKILVYDQRKETYKISPIIQEEMNNRQ